MPRSVEEMSSFLEDDKNHEQYLKFDNVKNPLSRRPDIHGYLLLERLAPAPERTRGFGKRMVCAAEHDEVWLSADPEKVAAAATDEDLLDLLRCGIGFDDDNVSFHMFA